MTRSLPVTLLLLSLLGMVIGAAAGWLASEFADLVLWLNAWLAERARESAGGSIRLIALVVCIPALGGLVVGLLLRGLPGKRVHGAADAIEAVHRQQGIIDWRTGVRAALANLVALGSGSASGQYGPLVHLGAALGSMLTRHPVLHGGMRSIGAGCGVAAAIAAAFGAPIAGVLFAHEVVLRHYSLRAFAPITVAAVTGNLFGHVTLDATTLRLMQRITDLPAITYLHCVVLGVICALGAWLFMRAVEQVARTASRTALPDVLKPALAGAVLGITAIFIPDVIGTGLEPMRLVLLDEYPRLDAFTLLVAKFAVAALCLGLGYAGGIFSPALLLGALVGSVFALSVESISPAIVVAQVYEVSAMAAFAAAVIGGPLTTILIIFELTQNYQLTTAVMVCVVFSNLVSYRIYGRSFFDRQLLNRGIDFSLGPERVRLQHTTIAAYVSEQHPTLAASATLNDARERLLQAGANKAHLLDESGRYAGNLTLATLEQAIDEERGSGSVRDVASDDMLVLLETTSVWDAMHALEGYTGEGVPVVGPHNEYRGILYESSVIRAYFDVVDTMRREEHAIG